MPNKSPCHSCERAALDKKECAEKCDRLAAYNWGEPWEGIETPEEFRASQDETDIIDTDAPVEGQEKNEASNYAYHLQKKAAQREAYGAVKTCCFPNCEAKVLARGVCKTHYEQWRFDKLPGYPPYKEGLQVRHWRKKQPAKKAKKREVKVIETRATLLDSQVVVDLSFYPKLRDCIFATAEKFMVPPAHIMISLAGEALAAKRNNG